MPTANWLQPITPAGGYAPEPEPQGLLGFLGAGPDFGADVGDRLGVISQILMNLGSGRGGAGIAEATAAVNSRSEARRERRKAERMVARAADKIEPSNPELAAAFRANTAFGMQMLGKQFELEGESKNALALQKEKYKLDLENDLAVKAAERKAYADAWAQLGLTPPSGGATSPGVTTPQQAEAMPSDAQVPAYDFTPDITMGTQPIPDGMSAGTGTEPAPSQIPTSQVPQQQPAIGSLDPVEAVQTMLSSDPKEAAWQIDLTKKLRIPVPSTAITALKMLAGRDPKEAAPILNALAQNWEEHKRFVLQEQGQNARARQAVEDQKAEEDRALQEKLALPGLRQKQFLEGVTPAQGQPQTPYDPGNVPTDLQDVGILQNRGFDSADFSKMGNARVEAQRILTGAGTEAGPGQATQDVQARLTKREEDIPKEAAALKSATTIQASVDALQKSIPNTPENAQAKAELAAIPTAKDPADQINKWRKTNQELVDSNDVIRNRADELTVKQDTLKLAQDKAKQDVVDAEVAKTAKRERALNDAFAAQDTIRETVATMYEGTDPKTGLGGALASIIPGTSRKYAEGLVGTLDAYIAEDRLAGMREGQPSGASGLGSLTAPELIMLKSDRANILAALESNDPRKLERALKLHYNHWSNVIDPTGGTRLDMSAPGYQEREFRLKEDNPALYQLKKERGELKESTEPSGSGVIFEWSDD